MIAAHPFRGFLLFGVSQLRVDVEQACRRPIFRHVDAVEVLNCRLTLEENEMARKVAGRLGLPGLAGSDAHRTEEVGRCITILQKEVDSVEELVAELRSGRFRTETLR
jgi:predicted metal-dependent phosphoesterase TrpH